MNYNIVLLLLLSFFILLQFLAVVVESTTSTISSSCLECHIVQAEVLFDIDDEVDSGSSVIIDYEDDNSNEDFKCITTIITEYGTTIRQPLMITLPDTFIEDNYETIISGNMHICIDNASININNNQVIYDNNISDSTNTIHILLQDGSNNRYLQQDNNDNNSNDNNIRFGIKTLLAVRVKTIYGQEPVETLDDIEGTIFGTGKNAINNVATAETDGLSTVINQYNDITHGKLQFVTPTIIPNGVIEITIEQNITGKDIELDISYELLYKTTEAINDIISSSTNTNTTTTTAISLSDIANNVIFCLPNGGYFGNDDTWTAFTFLFEPYSYYQKSRCTRLSVAVHEIGHSIGFQHSGRELDIYADKTGYMGYANNNIGFPKKAFNGHKHWISGWFADRSMSTYPTIIQEQHVLIRLVAFVEYSNTGILHNDDVVIINVMDDLYIQYNYALTYNIDTDLPNTITITQASNPTAVSYHLAALNDDDDVYIHQYPNNDSNDLINIAIKVCNIHQGDSTTTPNIPAHAMVSIYVDDGNQNNETICTMPPPINDNEEENYDDKTESKDDETEELDIVWFEEDDVNTDNTVDTTTDIIEPTVDNYSSNDNGDDEGNVITAPVDKNKGNDNNNNSNNSTPIVESETNEDDSTISNNDNNKKGISSNPLAKIAIIVGIATALIAVIVVIIYSIYRHYQKVSMVETMLKQNRILLEQKKKTRRSSTTSCIDISETNDASSYNDDTNNSDIPEEYTIKEVNFPPINSNV